MKKRMIPALLAGGLLGSCSLIPDYQRPDAPIAPAYPAGPAYAAEDRSADKVRADALGWRDYFTDPALQRLIEIALANNRDLRIAALDVEAAQAQYRVQHAGFFPQISASAGAQVERSAALVPNSDKAVMLRSYSAGIGVTSYELDLFGRVQSLSEEAFEQYLGQEETRRSVLITLVGQVAAGYFAVLADRDLVHLTEETLKSETASYDLTKMQLVGGTATALSARQAETAVDAARANLVQYTRQAAQDENALALLIGQPIPSDLPPGRGLEGQGMIADLPASLPSELLARRPDVLAAEHQLIAANADIGAARAAFFPSITLTASGGVASDHLNHLFNGNTGVWSFAPQVTLPLFTGGQNEANLDLSKIEKNIQVAQYEKAIQTAFREVADALAARGTYGKQVEAQRSLVEAARASLDLSEQRFKGGVDSYLPVLDAERSLYSAQQTLLTLKQAQLGQEATLYKALGGGSVERTAVKEAS